jgi:hypothetical protein
MRMFSSSRILRHSRQHTSQEGKGGVDGDKLLWFEVTVNDALRVHVADGGEDLGGVVAGGTEVEGAVLRGGRRVSSQNREREGEDEPS